MRWFDRRWQDIRYSVRMLRRSPAFTLVAVSVLALGIGVNAAVFSVVNAIFFRDLGVRAPEQLVYVYQDDVKYHYFGAAYDDVLFLREHPEVFSAVAGHRFGPERVTADGESESVTGERVTWNYFDVLGIAPQLGRLLQPSDADPVSTEAAVVLSDAYWTRKFGRATDVVGRQIRINGAPFSIVGVAPPRFVGLSEPWAPAQFWVTVDQALGSVTMIDPRSVALLPVARLAPGVPLERARAMAAAATPALRKVWKDRQGIKLTGSYPYVVLPIADVPIPTAPFGESVPRKLALAVAVVVLGVLLIAAANIAGILAARGIARTSELAVRQALGAGGARLVSQLLTESMLLACGGGAAGLLLAVMLTRLYAATTPASYVVAVAIDFRVVAFTLAVCALAGMLVGLAPALQARRVNLLAVLGGGGSTPRVRRRFRHGIIVPQVALAWGLLVLAGVHARALARIETMNLGYAVDHRVVLDVNGAGSLNDIVAGTGEPSDPAAAKAMRQARADGAREVQRQILAHATAVPGISAAGAIGRLPLADPASGTAYISDWLFRAGSLDTAPAAFASVTPGYFDAMGIPLKAGRDFRDGDAAAGAPPIAIVSEAVASKLFQGVNAVGRSIAYFPDNAYTRAHPNWIEVVGVVGDIDSLVNTRGTMPFIYRPGQAIAQGMGNQLVVKTAADAAAMVPAIKRAVLAADPTVEVSGARTMAQVIGQILYPRRAAAGLLGASGLAGLLLAAVGLYGVISYSVAQRLREIGVRATLGATRTDIMTMVMSEGARVTAIGGAIGFGLSLVALRVTSSLVGAVPTTDVAIFIAVPLVMMLVIGVASLAPARRAANVDPIEVLRSL